MSEEPQSSDGQMMDAMVVVAHGGPEQLQRESRSVPAPGPTQVRLRMLATSVNFADTKARRAPYRHFQAPFVPGFDGVGIVDSLGSDIASSCPLQPGQRVAAYVKGGSYAEYAVALPSLCFPIPDTVKDEDAIGIGVAITAYNALHWAGRLAPGERVLIHAAAGGVGSTAIQLAKLHGASQIIASIGNTTEDPEWYETKCKAARDAGADHVVTTKAGFAREVMTLTEDKGVDVILDTIGGEVLEEGLSCMADFGRLVSFGHGSGTDGHIPSKPLHRHNRSIIGYSSGGYRRHKPEALIATAHKIVALWTKGELETTIGGCFDLAQAAEAHARFEQRRNIGKMMLKCR